MDVKKAQQEDTLHRSKKRDFLNKKCDANFEEKKSIKTYVAKHHKTIKLHFNAKIVIAKMQKKILHLFDMNKKKALQVQLLRC